MTSYLFTRGPIYTMCGPRIDHGVLLTRGGVIQYVGPEDGLDPSLRGGAELIDLRGRPLFPGFCDGHVHLFLSAERQAAVDCSEVRTIDEVQQRLAERVDQCGPGAWIEGFGWERKRLFESQPPTVVSLDVVSPAHPVFLVSKDMHTAWLNTAGLERLFSAGDLPSKCQIHRVAGQPSGLVFEDILELKRRLIPSRSDAERQALLGPFMRGLHSLGITAVHCNELARDLPLVREYLSGTTERIRVLANGVFESPDELRQGRELLQVAVPGWLCPGGAKIFMDGSLGSLTAAISRPYVGTEDLGILNMDEHELDQWLQVIKEVGTYGVFHVIGDRAARTVLEGLDRFEWPEDRFHRLEHVQLLSPEILARHDFGKLVFSVQPSHMPGDREIVERHVPPVLGHRYAYAYQTMQRRGGVVVFGSDAPVEDLNPFKGIHAAVTRLQGDGTAAWNAAEGLSLFEALAAHTINPAFVHGNCLACGALTRGSRADLVVLDQDPFDRSSIADISAELTMLDGDVVFVAQGRAAAWNQK